MAYRQKKTAQYSSKQHILKYAALFLFIGFAVGGAVFFTGFYRSRYFQVPSLNSVYTDWEHKDYAAVYMKTAQILEKRPMDGTALALHGFSAYYLFAEQTDLSAGAEYLTASVVYLRRALYLTKKKDTPKIAYILGKAYYQQGYYYADLAVKYLDQAYTGGIEAEDLAEFRGMAASLLGDTDKAIAAFTQALALNPSDLVLYAVAENYKKKGDVQNAKLYLFETIKKTADAVLELRCRNQLGLLFLEEGKTAEALEQFNLVLKKDINSAEAHYGIGLIYEWQGDMIKARYEWRQALRLNPIHTETRAKLNIK
ncbi:MAG: tetratricopeptide repeat protein [Treponema sp.]